MNNILEKPSLYNITKGNESEDSLIEGHVYPRQNASYTKWVSMHRGIILLSVGMIISLAWNVVLSLKLQNIQNICPPDTGRSRFCNASNSRFMF